MTQVHGPWAGSDDEDDPDVRESWMWGGKKAFIFLIDATEPMFEKNIDDSSYFRTCIEACKEIMLKAVFEQEKDLFGIVLFGTKHLGQGSHPNHITTVQELALCNADKIKELLNILEDVDEFEKKHGHSNNFSLADALWQCSKMVSTCTTKISEKTVFLLTCNDNPHSANRKLQHDTRTRVRDLNEVDIKLEILPFGMTFNSDHFFKEVHKITHDDDDQSSSEIKIVKEVKDILGLFEKSPIKRSISRVLWNLGGDVSLGIAAYSFIRSTAPFPKKVRLERSKNTIVTSHVQTFKVDTLEEVSAAETSKALKIGGQTMTFQKEELHNMKNLTKKGLLLLGFKPTHTIALWYQMNPAALVYPEERIMKGSRTLFAALHERCLKRDLAAICYFTPRRSAKPSLVALIPQAEKLDKKNVQLLPPGFILRYLPYADNVRDLTEQQVNCTPPEPELVSFAENIIDKMKFKYVPSNIENPKLQKHWAAIEALALGYEEPRETPDLTLPDHEAIDERISDLAADFMSMAFPDGFHENILKKKATKRTAPEKPPAPKKVKPDLDSMSMEDIANQGLVEKLTVDKLKAYLSGEDVKISKMKKAQLVEAVYYHLGVTQP